MVEELRRVLFDPKPHYTINGSKGHSFSEELSMEGLISGHGSLNNSSQINYHDWGMPSEINKDMFQVIGRVLPNPSLDFEEKIFEPLTSVFADY